MPATGLHFYEGSTTDALPLSHHRAQRRDLVLTKATVEVFGDDVEAVQVSFNRRRELAPCGRRVSIHGVRTGFVVSATAHRS